MGKLTPRLEILFEKKSKPSKSSQSSSSTGNTGTGGPSSHTTSGGNNGGGALAAGDGNGTCSNTSSLTSGYGTGSSPTSIFTRQSSNQSSHHGDHSSGTASGIISRRRPESVSAISTSLASSGGSNSSKDTSSGSGSGSPRHHRNTSSGARRKRSTGFDPISEEPGCLDERGGGESRVGQCFEQLLIQAELHQYLPHFHNILGVRTIEQAKFVLEGDLVDIGMSGPEQRRFKHFYDKLTKKPNAFTRMKQMMFPKAKSSYATWSMPIKTIKGGNTNNNSNINNSQSKQTSSSRHHRNNHHPIQRGTPQMQSGTPQMNSNRRQSSGTHIHDDFISGSSEVFTDGGEDEGGSTHFSPLPINTAPYNRVIIPCEQIVTKSTIGEGEFGVVRSGVWTNEHGQKVQVAVKIVTSVNVGESGGGAGSFPDFIKEAGIMQSLEHKHLCKMYGLVLDNFNYNKQTLMLVTELAHGRSLLEALLNDTEEYLKYTVDRLCLFASQICSGMEYLERKRLIHRDLAARNILVFTPHLVKVSDFGLSRMLTNGKDYYQTEIKPNLRLPIAWCAPECANYLKFTSASDVWAFGVTLWEMFSYGAQPWPDLLGNEIIHLIDQPRSERLEQPLSCPTNLYHSLMMNCWQHEPDMRMTFAQISKELPKYYPQIVEAKVDYEGKDGEELSYTKGNIIYVLEERAFAQWKGVNEMGQVGTFKASQTTANIDRQKIDEQIRLLQNKHNHHPHNRHNMHDDNTFRRAQETQMRPHSLACKSPGGQIHQDRLFGHPPSGRQFHNHGHASIALGTEASLRLNSVGEMGGGGGIVSTGTSGQSIDIQAEIHASDETTTTQMVEYEPEQSCTLTEVTAVHSQYDTGLREDEYSLSPIYHGVTYTTPAPVHTGGFHHSPTFNNNNNNNNIHHSAFSPTSPFAKFRNNNNHQFGLRVDTSTGNTCGLPPTAKRVVQVKPFNREQDSSISDDPTYTQGTLTYDHNQSRNVNQFRTDSLQHTYTVPASPQATSPPEGVIPQLPRSSEDLQRHQLSQNYPQILSPDLDNREGSQPTSATSFFNANYLRHGDEKDGAGQLRVVETHHSSHPDSIHHAPTFRSPSGGSGFPGLAPTSVNGGIASTPGSITLSGAKTTTTANHQRSTSETSSSSKSRKSMAEQVAISDRVHLLGPAATPTVIPPPHKNKFHFKNFLTKPNYTDEERTNQANRMIAPGSSPTKYVHREIYPGGEFPHSNEHAELVPGSEARTLPRILKPSAKVQNNSTSSRSTTENVATVGVGNSSTASPVSHREVAPAAVLIDHRFPTKPAPEPPLDPDQGPALPPRIPISPVSTPEHPGTPQSPAVNSTNSPQSFFSQTPPVPPRNIRGIYARSNFPRITETHQRRRERAINSVKSTRPVTIQRQKSMDSGYDDRLGTSFQRNTSAPEFNMGSMNSNSSENESLRSPLEVFQQAPTVQSNVAILTRDNKVSNSSSVASSNAEMIILPHGDSSTTQRPRSTHSSNNSLHRQTSLPRQSGISRQHSFHQAPHHSLLVQHSSHNNNHHHHQHQHSGTSTSTVPEPYIDLSTTTSNPTLANGSNTFQRSNSSDMGTGRDAGSELAHITATIVTHPSSSPLESPQVQPPMRGYTIPSPLLAFYSTQKFTKNKRNSREEVGSSNTTISEARSYEDLLEAKLAGGPASDFESDTGSGSFVNPGFEYGLEPNPITRVQLRGPKKAWSRIGKSSSFNAGDIPHCQSTSNSSGSGGVVTGEAMSFSADSIARPRNFWTLDGTRNVKSENYSSLRKDNSISSVQEENEDQQDGNSPTKIDLLKNGKIKNLLPNAKKLKNAFQKPKSNESI